MDVLEFARERRRMCTYENCYVNCPLGGICCEIGSVDEDESNDIKIVEAVEKWSAEHPKKTRQTEMLKLFPETRLDERGIIDDICPAAVGAICPKEGTCSACREKWWGEEIE